MRLKKEILRARCKKKSLQTVEFLDLSKLELVEIEKLDSCDSLKWLIASKNKLQGDEGLENLKQLWYLDLSDNQICGLNALSRYLALGTVILTNNDLQWKDLEHIRHAHFLSISLHGNPGLDKDPYYRIHVIDCLPLIWELDGRLVTVTERLHVKQFFIDTELSQHPVRHKIGRTFKTSAIRNIGTEGVVSKQCKYIYSKFPMSETHTKHTDERRLRYLCNMVQGDIIRWFHETNKKTVKGLTDTFLEELLEQRKRDVERCNMVLLLLVISLEFQLPTALMKAVLGAVGLDLVGTVGTMPLFLLPRIHRTKVIGILLNAAKVDRDNNVNSDDGLYPQLFMCLYFNVARLTHISQTSEENMNRVKTLPMNADYMALMASEVVSLMLQVPKFFDSLLTDVGIIHLVNTAVGDHDVVERAQDKLVESQHQVNGPPLNVIHKMVAEMVFSAITKRLDNLAPKMTHIPIGDRYLALSDSLPIKPVHSVVWASQFLTNGQTIPNLEPPILNPVREAAKPKPIPPKMGDKVLLGPQVVGELASLLEGDIAMVKIDAVPISNGAVESKLKSSEAHFAYVDLKALCYARDIGMWRPAKTVGDKYTIHSTETCQMISSLASTEEGAAEPLIYSAREPEKVSARSAFSNFGLTSQMVHRSQSVGTGYLTGYRHSNDEYLGVLSTNIDQEVGSSGRLSFSNNNSMIASAKTLRQKKRILSAPATTSAKLGSTASPVTRVVEMNTLHLHDNVHHIRGLTPRAESDRSGALTSPSTMASPGIASLGPPGQASAASTPVLEHPEPETSRANTPTLVTDELVETVEHGSKRNQEIPLFSHGSHFASTSSH
ncbi:protein phosphatase 1 regulatory subunit 7 [Elysia marginata]|uniref:Protein phosphatase 1 regulatory subunit 7 n=1 Tax=Elysia marginata TaxID=1093978 RepID=A0AAV4EGF8_9GAST|nr:protein phosphatase 1 regulatory subunit 7 [Elysia marginata]